MCSTAPPAGDGVLLRVMWDSHVSGVYRRRTQRTCDMNIWCPYDGYIPNSKQQSFCWWCMWRNWFIISNCVVNKTNSKNLCYCLRNSGFHIRLQSCSSTFCLKHLILAPVFPQLMYWKAQSVLPVQLFYLKWGKTKQKMNAFQNFRKLQEQN